jgi:hypothetical protein
MTTYLKVFAVAGVYVLGAWTAFRFAHYATRVPDEVQHSLFV